MLRLIVADDAPFIREIVRHVVMRAGVQIVAEASDGVEAVSLALKEKPDVVLMDIVMPKKSGIDAAREILQVLPQTKIIAFSTADQENMIMSALDAGCCSFLTKPFSAEELLRVIQEASSKAS